MRFSILAATWKKKKETKSNQYVLKLIMWITAKIYEPQDFGAVVLRWLCYSECMAYVWSQSQHRLHVNWLEAKNKHLDTLSTIARSIAIDINVCHLSNGSCNHTLSIVTSEIYTWFFRLLVFFPAKWFFFCYIINTFWTCAFFFVWKFKKTGAQHISYNQHFYCCYCLMYCIFHKIN